MKVIHILFLLLYCFTATTFGQTVEEKYTKTIFCQNDLFAIKYDKYPKLDTFKVSRTDKTSPGMDARLNGFATIYFNSDSIRLKYNNRIPYQHNFYINFESPKGKTTLRFHFNSIANYFDKKFIEQYDNKVAFDIPAVYELANIIWTLSPSGQRANGLNLEGDYYKKVSAYFKPYLDHPIFKYLDFVDSIYVSKYFDFRENSFAYNFQDAKLNVRNTKLLFNGPYYYVYGDELADSSLFGKLKTLVEDFALRSNFKQFYKSNLNFYDTQIKREKELLPIKKMWSWLEFNFPKEKFNSYKIVFSPLIGGSHSTQKYFTHTDNGWFGQIAMFICNADRVDEDKKLTEKQKEALMSGVVFTEIDHNYVNPATNRYAKQIDSIFSNRSIWAKKNSSSDFYESSTSVFNEYMTWAVFCLYIADNYDKETKDLVIAERESRMANIRNFIKFKEFDQSLLKIRLENKNLKVVDLYPFILDWCKRQL
ncbi:MAG: DUF4932 domain-containing protein [Pelobium sp.]